LEYFYVENAKSDIIELFETINDLDESEYSPDLFYQLSIANQTNLDMVVINHETNDIYTPTNPFFVDELSQPREAKRSPPNTQLTIKTENIDENSSFIWFLDNNINMEFLTYEGTLDNGNDIMIRIPMASVSQTVQVLNQYILIVGAIIFVISMAAADTISKHFTNPILNIFDVTNSIRNLDFSKTCDVTTNDEIGRLSVNINDMSFSLKKNIGEMADVNKNLKIQVEERLKIDEQRKTLLNNVSHELKTPLSLVQGYSEGLKLNLHSNKDKTDFYCDVIIDEAKKMDLLVSQLLDINHIQFGDFPLHKEITNGKEFLTYILKKYQTLFEQPKIDFTSNLESLSDAQLITIDSLRSEQVLTNLLNNALAYVDEKKQISFATSIIEDPSMDHKHLRVIVSNSFKSLQQEELDKLWNSFYKTDTARTRENGGYGLGLSIIKAIQEADSNQYGVNSEKDKISFWVDFDLA
jgi:signal transduction histidine kinase